MGRRNCAKGHLSVLASASNSASDLSTANAVRSIDHARVRAVSPPLTVRRGFISRRGPASRRSILCEFLWLMFDESVWLWRRWCVDTSARGRSAFLWRQFFGVNIEKKNCLAKERKRDGEVLLRIWSLGLFEYLNVVWHDGFKNAPTRKQR